ncbi:hypothetical protein Cgig2_028900 [Carnegiea gigantea]|uniref:Uncharacterized protein n=1 Tax=Carnegiea gigantea TaxID=171969 RepID=A0A9Q1KQY1_9CARY|nr:hypothetical protein Cgig2_028900 [Carnegiea gigantea]
MESQLRALLEEQLAAQNLRISELRLEQQQMFEKMMTALQKERTSELKPFVKAMNPETLQNAISLARLQEEAMDVEKEAGKGPYKPALTNRPPLLSPPRPAFLPHSNMPSAAASASGTVARPFSQTFKNTRVISAAERAEKNAKGLCYFCDQPYERGHKCSNKKTQLFLVEIPGETNEEDEGFD